MYSILYDKFYILRKSNEIDKYADAMEYFMYAQETYEVIIDEIENLSIDDEGNVANFFSRLSESMQIQKKLWSPSRNGCVFYFEPCKKIKHNQIQNQKHNQIQNHNEFSSTLSVNIFIILLERNIKSHYHQGTLRQGSII